MVLNIMGCVGTKSKFHVLNYNIWLLVYLLYESREMQYMIDYS